MQKTIVFKLLFIIVFTQVSANKSEKINAANTIIYQSINKLVGQDHFSKIKNLTFKTSSKDYRTVKKTYFADNQMNFKMTVGYGPYVERITLFKNGKIFENNFLTNGTLSTYDKTELTCFAKIISGIFTLARFKNDLTYEGKKKYGFKEYIILKTSLFEHTVSFYLESGTFFLARMIISGTDKEGIFYQSMFDFKDPIRMKGIILPGDWVHNTLGFNRESDEANNKIKDFKTNIKIKKDFWEDINLNFGSVKMKDGVISGNVIEPWVHHRLKIMMMSTNIRWTDMEKLDLKQHDDIIVVVDGIDYPGVYFPNKSINPPRHKYKPGVIFAGDIDAPYLGLFMWDKKFREIFENKTPPLLSVKIHKK